MEFGELKEVVWAKLQEPRTQRKLVLVIVSIALLLDNMLYMVIVPIIPDYLRYIGAYQDFETVPGNVTLPPGTPTKHDHHGQDSATGILFASKAIVQLMVNPFSGALIDRIGYDIPMMIGLTIMFLSTAVFACGRSYGLLFFARSLQGVGSAFADTSGLAMIADRFTEENERSKALGIALAFISFGCLVAPPFGGALYQFAGKEMPFLILAFVSLMDGFMLLLVMKPIKEQIKLHQLAKPPSVPIWRLFMDKYIAVCAGALMMSNVALAFLEPTISLWIEDNLTTENWKVGIIWLPAFFPHVFGVILTVKMAKKVPSLPVDYGSRRISTGRLMLFYNSICKFLRISYDTYLRYLLWYRINRHRPPPYLGLPGGLAYAVGPIIAGGVVEAIGFTALNVGIAFSNLLYAPVLYYLKDIYDFKPFENEANILMSDPPNKEYQTYSMQEQKPVSGDVQNHLEYKQQEKLTLTLGTKIKQQHQPYHETPYQPPQQQQQPPPRPPGRVLPQQPEAANPFRPQTQATGGNPFRQGF
ncbi:hypothetical protein NQ314_018951 [Rhamnusium bicolor]|uniref:Major facilitator superfamily (MFS) profile domain-containing protein n=1 Tax=Rhamnusium bicolor TaxID=1586634 RepID=A0AAV8WQQ8_9CUCU|nr:hypothetical protein NQ314_018951 [Rhamnusium bicolor]